MSEPSDLSCDAAAAPEDACKVLDAQSEPTPWRLDAPVSTAPHRPAAGMLSYDLVKRLFDMGLAACLLAILSPLMLLIAVAIRLDSPGPVVFRQRRTGRYGKAFDFLKFRSLTWDQDHTMAHREFMRRYANSRNGGSRNSLNKPSTNSRAVTRVGRRLRRYSLDELPQLWNILKGDMSFVGPRAWPEYELENYQDWHYRRLDVLPGLTGLAQVNGRSRLSFDEMIRLDIVYVEQRSMLRDLKIVIKTIPVVISGEDAG